MMITKRLATAALFAMCGALSISPFRAQAHGTARIEQPNGNVKTYNNVLIRIKNAEMAITSADGKGTLVLGKAACTLIGQVFECIPYDATLLQNGTSAHIPLQSGTVYYNPTGSQQPITNSSKTLPPHGVLLSVRTKRGTYVSLSGTADQVQK